MFNRQKPNRKEGLIVKFHRALRIGGAGLVIALAVYYGNRSWQSAEPSLGSGDALVQISVPALTGPALQGQQTFRQNCAVCHGKNADGREGSGPPLVHKIYEPDHHGDIAFFMAVKNGVRAHHWPFGNMPPISDLTDSEIERVVAYVRTLQRANDIH